MSGSDSLRIAIVGPCSAGKTMLAEGLLAVGYEDVRQPAQEHSYVPTMWQRITQPDILIYLDVDYQNVNNRRPRNNGGRQRLAEQHRRLAHAYQHCDFYLDTSDLTPTQIYTRILSFLQQTIG